MHYAKYNYMPLLMLMRLINVCVIFIITIKLSKFQAKRIGTNRYVGIIAVVTIEWRRIEVKSYCNHRLTRTSATVIAY